MELNKEISTILKQFKIDVNEGTLCLLAYYHNLNVEAVIPEYIIRAVNLTKIVERDYKVKSGIVWNVPLYLGEETSSFEWVIPWMESFARINPERRGAKSDCIKRMKMFFSANPELRKDDVIIATAAYFKTVRDPQYLKAAHKFIYEGTGAMKSSMLLQWCEATKDVKVSDKEMRGVVK